MVSEGILKNRFVEKILERDATFIKETQQKVVAENFRVLSGELLKSVSHKSHELSFGDSKVKLWFKILPYLRFLDIKSSKDRFVKKELRKNLALYNRVIWGRLFNETLTDLKYGFNEAIREEIKQELEKAANPVL